MADWYVWSGATGLADGTSWDDAYVTLQEAVGGKAAGDVFWVAHDHIQTQATTLSFTVPGTNQSPSKIYCVDRAGSVPPVSADLRTTAQINTTEASTIQMLGCLSEVYGLRFQAGSGSFDASLNLIGSSSVGLFRKCRFKLNTDYVAARIAFATAVASLCILDDCAMEFGSANQRMSTAGRVYWLNTPSAAILGTIPTWGLLSNTNNGLWHIEGVDLSALGANELVDGTSAAGGLITIKDCKLGSGPVLHAELSLYGGQEVYIIRSDNGDRNYRNEKHSYSCVQTTETAIVRIGGASDGTTPVGWKFVTSANACKELAFLSMPIVFWNESAGGAPRIITIQGLWNGPAAPLNNEIWLDVSYLGTPGFPLARFASTKPADNLAADAVSYPPGEGTWTGGVMVAFAMTATITPMEKGPITVYVRVGKPSSTFYIDPRPVVT